MLRVHMRFNVGRQGERSIRLMSQQELTVGRSYWADVTIPDPQLSDIHFRIKISHRWCHLSDLASGSGTYVNGRPVSHVVLRCGDTIRSGETLFHVAIEGDAGDLDGDADRFAGSRPIATSEDDLREYTRRTLPSGITCLTGSVPADQPGGIADIVSSLHPLAAIVDFHRADVELPAELATRRYLLDWLPEGVLDRSPLIILPSDNISMRPLIDELWGQDALIMIVLAGDVEEGTVLQQIQSCPGFFTHPSVLAPQLQLGSPEAFGSMLANIVGICLESPTAMHWEVYGMDDRLSELGLAEQDHRSSEDPFTATPAACG